MLKYCGGLKDPSSTAHFEFFGADTYFKQGQVYNYAVSVPLRKVKLNEVLLAWEMNGKPLPKIHGYPLRTVVFGYIGARSCKWLTRINVIQHESLAPVQKKEYLYVRICPFMRISGEEHDSPSSLPPLILPKRRIC